VITKKHDIVQSRSARHVLPPWRHVFNLPGVDEAGAHGPHWFAGYGMLVAGGF